MTSTRVGYCHLWQACLLAAAAMSAAGGAHGALGCEQILAVARDAVQYRDQGYSLQQVLAGLKGIDAGGKLSAEELQTLQKAVSAVYLGSASPEEVALACREAREQSRK